MSTRSAGIACGSRASFPHSSTFFQDGGSQTSSLEQAIQRQMPDSQQILIFSDGPLDKFTRVALEERGFGVTVARDAEKAYGQLLGSPCDLVIVDVARAQKGVEFIKRLRATPKLSRAPVLTIATWGTGQATLALTEGADAFEAKPLKPDRLIAAIEKLLRQRASKTAVAAKVARNDR